MSSPSRRGLSRFNLSRGLLSAGATLAVTAVAACGSSNQEKPPTNTQVQEYKVSKKSFDQQARLFGKTVLAELQKPEVKAVPVSSISTNNDAYINAAAKNSKGEPSLYPKEPSVKAVFDPKTKKIVLSGIAINSVTTQKTERAGDEPISSGKVSLKLDNANGVYTAKGLNLAKLAAKVDDSDVVAAEVGISKEFTKPDLPSDIFDGVYPRKGDTAYTGIDVISNHDSTGSAGNPILVTQIPSLTEHYDNTANGLAIVSGTLTQPLPQ